MEIKIRKAIAEDYETSCDLFDEVDTLHRDNLPHIFKKPSGPIRERDYFLGLIQDENVGLFVAEVEGTLLGFVHVMVKDTLPIPVFVPRHCAIIDSIAVKPRYRAKGIGKMLMNTAHEWARVKGATAIELNVYEFNQQAIAFYAGLGYASLSRRMSRSLNSG